MLLTVIEGSRAARTCSSSRVASGSATACRRRRSPQFDELIRAARNQILELGDGSKVFAEVYAPPPRLLVYGAVDTAEALCKAANLLGWTTIVADARAEVRHPRADPERRPS